MENFLRFRCENSVKGAKKVRCIVNFIVRLGTKCVYQGMCVHHI